MSTMLLGHHIPGTTRLHRLPAGTKLGAMLLIGLIVVVVRGPVSALVAVAMGLALLLWAGAGLRLTLRAIRGVLVVALCLGGWLAWQQGWASAVEGVGDLLALVLVATVLTLTTPVDELLDTIAHRVRFLRPLGVDPERVALAFGLMIRAIPATVELAEETQRAARARGLERSLPARLVPLVIRVVARAQHTGDALHARGLGD
ncbi:energy-coupling factor transporter transmembrane component T family protein [Nocardioides insulae]|uniref:energy-coupling factor transporter transmembrane component T family protein n=1 Tax=Nocardioides insulae TaxID=394734 RepID=UPI00049043AA|nr:energy-coupling factor transporter transmembrane component T [Nocardioides insulae]